MKLVLVRHGATVWSVSGQHTGNTDIPLTDLGRIQAEQSRIRVHQNIEPATRVHYWASPLIRARSTAEIVVGEDGPIHIDDRLREFDYGDYEGLTKSEIQVMAPGWTVFEGCPGGESLSDVEDRVDSFIADARTDTTASTTVIFAHGHLLRILGARSIGQPGGFARHLALDTGSVSVIADLRDGPAITLWNDIRH